MDPLMLGIAGLNECVYHQSDDTIYCLDLDGRTRWRQRVKHTFPLCSPEVYPAANGDMLSVGYVTHDPTIGQR
jgi:hypothetical protein